MRRAILSFAAALTILALSSCEKCATCTSLSDDPQTEGQTLTTEVCGKGKDYSEKVEIYERTGWECADSAE